MMDHNDNSQTNLIVNYLPQTLGDGEFRHLFQSVGPLRSCKIVRHKSTGYSYGFGFVDYDTAEDAVKAIESLNGYIMQNKKLKVAYARPGGEVIKNANLYVKGIPRNMPQEDLAKMFSNCGQIIQCRMLRDDMTGENKGVAFVLFDLHEQAEKAIEIYSGQTLPGSTEPLSIKFAEDNAKKVRMPPGHSSSTQHYIPTTTSSSGASMNRGGSPMRNSPNGNGGGPVRPNSRYRYSPMASSNSFTIGGGTGLGPIGDGPGHILFVYNIGIDTDEKSLWQLFSQYGTIVKVDIIRDPGSGASKGFGFVTMPNYEEAVWAIESLNGFRYAGRPLQVSFKTSKMP